MSPHNLAASVKARLQKKAEETGQLYNHVLQLYAMERFLYRLSQSEHADTFILKGALLFMVWGSQFERRTTMDIDLLGFTDNDLNNIEKIARNICSTEVEDDGIELNIDDIRIQRIKEDADYEGVRIRTVARLGNSRVQIQVDIGFGDALVPEPLPATIPTILNFPAPQLRCYHALTVVAEKFQAMIQLGILNSRMKDFYDIWNIIQHKEIDGAVLQTACAATFEHRATPFDLSDHFFSKDFATSTDKQTQWSAFLRKQRLENIAPEKFAKVVAELKGFFVPMVEHQVHEKTFTRKWDQTQHWK